MSSMLHIVNKSPSERTALASCLRLANDGDSILLIEDGVYAALKTSTVGEHPRLGDGLLNLFVLKPDVQARGLQNDELIKGIELIDYAGFVDLVATNPVSQSWL